MWYLLPFAVLATVTTNVFVVPIVATLLMRVRVDDTRSVASTFVDTMVESE